MRAGILDGSELEDKAENGTPKPNPHVNLPNIPFFIIPCN